MQLPVMALTAGPADQSDPTHALQQQHSLDTPSSPTTKPARLAAISAAMLTAAAAAHMYRNAAGRARDARA